jgi:hypothetical protein
MVPPEANALGNVWRLLGVLPFPYQKFAIFA